MDDISENAARFDAGTQIDGPQIDDGLRWVMNDARGRRVVWAVLHKAGVYRLSFDLDPCLTAFNEGRRDIGNGLLADVMRLCPDQYPRMAAEAQPQSTSGETDGRDDR